MAALSGLDWPRRGLLLAAGATLAAVPGARKARAAGAFSQLREDGPKPLPEFSFVDAEGQERRVADFAGTGLLINLWATWCGPCVEEMPALDRAQAALLGDGIQVLALSSDRGGKAVVEPFLRDRKIIRLGLWLDPKGAAGRAMGVRGLPTTLVVDRQGRETARLEGAAVWDSPPMLAAVRRLVGPVARKPAEDESRT
ncbi:MAG: TlpA family protein disulfide reductase [Paracraurococcus sp.]